jgi:hypothetical protein
VQKGRIVRASMRENSGFCRAVAFAAVQNGSNLRSLLFARSALGVPVGCYRVSPSYWLDGGRMDISDCVAVFNKKTGNVGRSMLTRYRV